MKPRRRSGPDPFGPITELAAQRRRIRYGCLTELQFDDLERLELLGSATLADLASDRRLPESIVRAMSRHVVEGWVERVDEVGAWRLTRRGQLALEFAYDHMDTICSELDGELW